MKPILKHLLTLVLLCTLFSQANASHLVGGSLGYEYVGQVGSNYRYKILYTIYVDCGPTSNVPFPENTQQVGVYDHDIQNDPVGGGDKTRIQMITVNLVSTTLIEPDQPPGCSVGASTCIREGKYEGFVDVPVNFNGYHLYADICCRNGAIVNLDNPVNQGNGFYSYIPPPLVPNSSPVFTDLPVPFLCVGDTTSLLNSAYDPDGDLMVFSFVEPYKGFGSQGNYPNPPATLTWPLDPTIYAAGYSMAQPFGAGGYSYINATTGLTSYMAPATGNYVVAVEIKEYRNGNLIGITKRDLQLLVINCPANPAPNLDPSAGTTSTQFSMEEGETLCFDFGYDDPNGDSLTLTANGIIFDASFVNPPATINTPVSGLDTVSTEFCWTTACGQAQALPYQFQVSVTDRGCPPKTTNDVYQITVNPTPPPDTIIGPNIVCQYLQETYSTQSIANTTYNWSITGGNIVNNYGDSVDVEWTSVGTGTLTLSATNQFGCNSAPIELDVTVVSAPIVNAGNDTTICFGDTITLNGTTTASPGYTATWAPSGSLSNANSLTPDAFPSDTTQYVLTVDIGSSCVGTDTVNVFVSIPTVDAGLDTAICAGDSIQLNGSSSTGTILWSPAADLDDATSYTPWASPTATTDYIIENTDALGCVITDTMTLTVDVGFTLTTTPDTSICANDCFNLMASGAQDYAWEPAASLNDSTLANPVACPTTNTTYTVYAQSGACLDTGYVNVTVNNQPTVDAGLDVDICLGDTIQITASGADTYVWTPTDSISDPNINNPLVWPTDTTMYYVTGTDANGCSAIDSIQVNVNPLPVVFAGNDTSYCIGDSVQLNATGADTYVWTPTTDLSDPNIANPYATGTGNMTYIVEGTDANGCVNTDTIDVTVNALPVITISNDTTICINDTISLTAGGGDTYSWNPTATLGTPSQATTTAFPVTTTTYEAIVTDLNGCVDSAEVDVTVQTLPAVDAGLDVDICFGDTIQLTATGATGYTWAPADSISNINIADPLVWPSDTTEYIVTGADGLNCINTDTVVVNVNPLPTPDAGPDLWVCPGDQVQINATGGGTYSWSPATGLSDPNIDNPMAGPADTTIYILSVTDGNGCIDTDTMTVFVNATVPTDAGTDTTICEGDTIQIGGAPTSVNGTTFFWTPAGLVDDPNVANPMAFPTVDTWFYVATTNDTCSGLDSVLVTVNPYPLANAGADIQICIGDTAQLGATGGVSYVWTPDLDLSDDSIAGPQAWPMDTTAYVVAVTDANGCTQTDTMEVIVNPLPTVSAGADDAICLGDTAQLSASGGDLYTWTPADSLSDANIFDPMAWPTATTDYMVTVTDSNGCINSDTMTLTVNSLPVVDAGTDVNICIGDSTQLGASGADTYVWTPGTDLSDPNIADPWATSIFTQNYVVEGTDGNGCQNTDTVLVVVNNLPNVVVGPDAQICIGDTTQLVASGANSFSWSPATGLSDANIEDPLAFPTDTTEYIVTGTDGNGCVNTDTIVLTVNPLPNANAGPDVDICLGDSVQLNATGGLYYNWDPAQYIDNPTYFNPMAFPDTTMDFIVTVRDSNTCINYDTLTINVFRVATIPDTAFCFGDSVQLDVFGSAANSYSWSPSAGLTDPNIANPWASPTSTTTYSVTVTNIAGCEDEASVEIGINALPVPSFTYDTEITCDGIEVSIENTSTIANSYVWNFSNGVSSIETDPVVVFEYGNSYSMTLTAYNEDGCVADTTVNDLADSFDEYFSIMIPNVFTPNDDGQNDIFLVEVPGTLSECVNLQVYNRWGQMVFKSYGNVITWDGYTPEGEKVPEGSYFYTIDIKGKTFKGHINIFR